MIWKLLLFNLFFSIHRHVISWLGVFILKKNPYSCVILFLRVRVRETKLRIE